MILGHPTILSQAGPRPNAIWELLVQPPDPSRQIWDHLRAPSGGCREHKEIIISKGRIVEKQLRGKLLTSGIPPLWKGHPLGRDDIRGPYSDKPAHPSSILSLVDAREKRFFGPMAEPD